AGVVSIFGYNGLTRSRWQREPSVPQVDWTRSHDRHLPSGPRTPGPPRVPHSALALVGNTTHASRLAATRSDFIVVLRLGRCCGICSVGPTAADGACAAHPTLRQ